MKTNARDRARHAIISFLSGRESATRREILDGSLRGFGLSDGEIASKNQNGKYGTARSYLGVTLSDLIRGGDVGRGGNGYMLLREDVVIIKEEEAERKIRASLAKRPYSKNDLIRSLENIFGTRSTASKLDDQQLYQTVERLLSHLVCEGEIALENGRYFAVEKTKNPCEPMELDDFKNSFFEYLSSRGGPAFERYVSGLLEKYFMMTGREVLFAETTGGSDDGGIDVQLDVVDSFGFVDHILAQTKCRRKMHVTEKEVREFYGSFCAKGGSRGMFITTSTFHPIAQNFLDSIDNIVGVDGEKLFSIAMKTSYGIRTTRAGYVLDASVFD